MMRSMGRYGDEEQRGRLALILRRDYLLGALALLVLGVFIGAIIYSALQPAPAPSATSAPPAAQAPSTAGGGATAAGPAGQQAAGAEEDAGSEAVAGTAEEPPPARLPAMVSLPSKVYLGSPQAQPLKPICAAQQRILDKYGLVVTNNPA